MPKICSASLSLAFSAVLSPTPFSPPDTITGAAVAVDVTSARAYPLVRGSPLNRRRRGRGEAGSSCGSSRSSSRPTTTTTTMQTVRSPHGAGRRQRAQGLVRRRSQSGGSTTPTATAVEVKEASPQSSGVFGRRGGWGLRVPFAPAFPGVGVAPTQVVSRLPEGMAPPQGQLDER